jgi:DMSO/TMAO reductase YedYZ molybdopterin-dependent catalytic subunit
MEELEALSPTEGWGGTISSAGVITPPQRLKGVSITLLAELVGGLEPGMGVNVIAKDGYGMTMSYEQIVQGDYITYEPGTGEEVSVEGPLLSIVAFEREGGPISSDEDGPLRLFIVSENNDNLVDGHWTVKWVTQIRIKPMSEEWSLNLEGTITELMDRNSFESCSAPDCHQASWTDESGNEWGGVPLYYLAGRVDDEVRHEERAYNDAFAKAGYVLQLFAADGYNIGIESTRTDFNRQILVASTVNGEPLEDNHFPLRLVGDGLETNEMVGQIVQIIIKPGEGVAVPTSEPSVDESIEEPVEMVLPEGAVLMIFGQVVNKLTLGLENLQVMNVIELETEHPKSGLQTYQGVRLIDLLNLAGVDPDSTVLVITASDGYAAEANLGDVLDCADCLVALNEDGTLNMVMAGMDSSVWVKDVNFLEIK